MITISKFNDVCDHSMTHQLSIKKPPQKNQKTTFTLRRQISYSNNALASIYHTLGPSWFNWHFSDSQASRIQVRRFVTAKDASTFTRSGKSILVTEKRQFKQI